MQHGGHGDEAEDDADGERDGQRVADGDGVEVDVAPEGQALEVERGQRAQRGHGEQEPGPGRDQGEGQALRDELARDLPAARAQGQPGRQLLESRARAHEGEVRDVDAADEEHEQRAAPEEVQGRLHEAHEVVLQPDDLRAETRVDQELLVFGKALQVGGVQGVDLGLGLREGGARLEPSDVPVVVAVPLLVRALLGREGEGPPQHHLGVEGLEAARHDADDRVGLPVEAQVASDHAGVGPNWLCQSASLSTTRLSLPTSPSSSVNTRPRAGATPMTRKYDGVASTICEAHGQAFVADADAAALEHGLGLEDGDGLQAVVVVGHAGVRAVRGPRLRVEVAHQHDPGRLGHGQGTEEDVMDDGEEGGVGPDADGQGRGGGQAEGPVADQDPCGDAQIADEPIQGHPPRRTSRPRWCVTRGRGPGSGFFDPPEGFSTG